MDVEGQARVVVQHVVQLNKLIQEQQSREVRRPQSQWQHQLQQEERSDRLSSPKIFVEATRSMLGQLNMLIERVKGLALVQEENELRGATYAFISAAKQRMESGASLQEYDQAVSALAENIRQFVKAASAAVVPPPPPPREDFAQGGASWLPSTLSNKTET